WHGRSIGRCVPHRHGNADQARNKKRVLPYSKEPTTGGWVAPPQRLDALSPFVPAKAGTQAFEPWPWIPAFAGMHGVFAALSPRRLATRSVRELERDHPGDDERGAEPAPEARGVAEKPYPHQEGSGGADAGPHRVGGAERDVPLRQKEQAAADRERDDCDR